MVNILIIILLIIGCIFVLFGYTRKLICPPQQIIYRLINTTPMDYQFSEKNLPTKHYEDMFTKDNITIGGYKLSSGRTVSSETK